LPGRGMQRPAAPHEHGSSSSGRDCHVRCPARYRHRAVGDRCGGLLGSYRELTLSAYRRDLLCFWQWCADHQLPPLAVRRPHLELYLRGPRSAWLCPSHHQPPPVHRRRDVQVRGHRRARCDQPDHGGDPAAGAVGGAAPHGAAPAGVRGRAQRRPPAQSHRSRAGRAAGPARPAGERSLQRPS